MTWWLLMPVLAALASLASAVSLSKELRRQKSALSRLKEKTDGAVAELIAEKARLSAILAGMVEAVVAVDNRGDIILVNAGLCELFSIDAQASQGKPFLEVLRQAELADILKEVLIDGKPRQMPARLFAPQERVFECHAVPLLRGKASLGALLVLHDITQVRRLEQMRRDLVANVSHELRTPLSAIKGYAETLLGGALEEPANRLEFVSAIEKEADNMSRLVDDLLDLAAIESGRRKPALEAVSLFAVAKNTIDKLRAAARKRNVSLEILPAEAPQVRADGKQLDQVFTNLIDNAIKYNREGGAVTVSFEAAADGAVTATVADTGIGVPTADLPRLFERFYRVDKSHSRELGGTGLGLSIVKHIVEAHHGSVSVESAEGQGSKFRFTLPAVV